MHAFASDPARGYFILAFLLVVIGVALALYAWRAPSLDSEAGFAASSRETFLLLNNVLLVIAASLILIGTLYPLFVEGLGMGKVSVGEDVFELVFIVPMLPLTFLIGIGMHASWRTGKLGDVLKSYGWVMGLAAVLGVFGPWLLYGSNNLMTALGITAGVWVMLASIAGPAGLAGERRKLTRAAAGMHLAHAGVGLFTIGATVVSSFGIEADRAIAPGEPVTAAGYTFDLQSLEDGEGPNYRYLRGVVTVAKDGKQIATLQPEKRVYRRQESPMTEAGIDASIARDVFVAMGDPLGDNKWSVRLQYKPLIRLIWIGCIVMALGGLLAMTDRRYRVTAKASDKDQKAGAPADPAAI